MLTPGTRVGESVPARMTRCWPKSARSGPRPIGRAIRTRLGLARHHPSPVRHQRAVAVQSIDDHRCKPADATTATAAAIHPPCRSHPLAPIAAVAYLSIDPLLESTDAWSAMAPGASPESGCNSPWRRLGRARDSVQHSADGWHATSGATHAPVRWWTGPDGLVHGRLGGEVHESGRHRREARARSHRTRRALARLSGPRPTATQSAAQRRIQRWPRARAPSGQRPRGPCRIPATASSAASPSSPSRR